jgi:hypothetical protein
VIDRPPVNGVVEGGILDHVSPTIAAEHVAPEEGNPLGVRTSMAASSAARTSLLGRSECGRAVRSRRIRTSTRALELSRVLTSLRSSIGHPRVGVAFRGATRATARASRRS